MQEALKLLQQSWERTREQWRDENAMHIEEEYLAPLTREFNNALPAIGTMAQTLSQAQRECSE
ncbi:MAG: hypothetical protein R3B90_07170 [Planctomycetaceae bacterium]